MGISDEHPGHFGNIRFPVTASSLLTVVLIIAAWIYASHPTWRATMDFLGVGFAMVATILSAYYIGHGLRITVVQRAEGLRNEKIARAFVYVDAWDHPYLSRTKQTVRDLLEISRNEKDSTQKIKEEIEKDKEKESAVWDVLNFLEGLSLAINQGVADDETLRRCFKSIAIEYFLALEGLIKDKRAAYRRPHLFAELVYRFT